MWRTCITFFHLLPPRIFCIVDLGSKLSKFRICGVDSQQQKTKKKNRRRRGEIEEEERLESYKSAPGNEALESTNVQIMQLQPIQIALHSSSHHLSILLFSYYKPSHKQPSLLLIIALCIYSFSPLVCVCVNVMPRLFYVLRLCAFS